MVSVGQPDPLERYERPLPPLSGLDSRVGEWQLDVADGCGARDQLARDVGPAAPMLVRGEVTIQLDRTIPNRSPDQRPATRCGRS
jgi:hypothetical protein